MLRVTAGIVAAMLFASGIALLSASTVRAGDVPVRLGAGSFRMPVTSIKEARFTTIVQQQYDFSCGSASVASLLTYHYGRPTSETEAFEQMFQTGDQESIKRYGFSLLDMKKYLQSRGLRADGFRIDLDKIAEVGLPAITLVTVKGYRHFVVVKGVQDGRVLIGDPALGISAMTRKRFEEIWDGITFLVRDEIPMGKENFNKEEEWALRPETPYGTALSRQGIATFSLLFPRANEF